MYALIQDPMYLILTAVGLLGYWLNIVERARQDAKKANTDFDKSNFVKSQMTQIVISILLTLTGNLILTEKLDTEIDTNYVYAIVAGLSWTGGSMTKYAIEVFPDIAKRFIDKFKNK